MKISEGSELPRFNLLTKVKDEILEVKYEDLFVGKTVALFGMPGAFTPTCSGQHLPSIIESEKDLKKKGVDIIGILTTNDPHVLNAWGKANNVDLKKIMLLCDPDAKFTEASGLMFSVPQIGLIRRSIRYAMIAKNGIILSLQIEESRGYCKTSSGEALIKNTNWQD